MRDTTKIIALIGSAFVAFGTAVVWSDAETATAKQHVGSPVDKSETPTLNAKNGTPATVVDDREAEGILGKNVRSSAGEDMGRIIDIIVNRGGQVRAAVIDFGGFLGVGSRKIAVAWSALHFPATGQLDPVTVNLTRDQVRLAPEILPGEPIVVLGSTSGQQAEPTPLTPPPGK
jgi:hypothetical protein